MDDHQTANAFLQLTHIGLLLRSRGGTGVPISFCASLRSASGLDERRRSISASRVAFSFSSSAYLSAVQRQRQFGLLMADGVETVAQAFDFIFFDFFHDDLICIKGLHSLIVCAVTVIVDSHLSKFAVYRPQNAIPAIANNLNFINIPPNTRSNFISVKPVGR